MELTSCFPSETTMNAWQEILGILKVKVNTQSYQTWLRPTRFSHVNQEALVVRVPNREFLDWIQEHYGSLINEALSQLRVEAADKKPVEIANREALQTKLDFDSTDHQLNPRYTFDTFVVGNCNQFA